MQFGHTQCTQDKKGTNKKALGEKKKREREIKRRCKLEKESERDGEGKNQTRSYLQNTVSKGKGQKIFPKANGE